MKRSALLIGLAAAMLVVFGGIGRARACGQGYLPTVHNPFGLSDLAMVGGTSLGLADLGLFGVDAMLTNGKGAPRWYGLMELGLAAPQAAVYGALLAGGGFPDEARAPLALATVLTGALTVHAVYVVFHAPPSQPRERQRERDDVDHMRGPRAPNDPDKPPAAARAAVQLNFAPTVFAARDHKVMPGAVLVGQF